MASPRDERELAALIRSLVESEISRSTPGKAGMTPISAPIPTPPPASPAESQDQLLARKVALWMGQALPASPAQGTWKKKGDAAFYKSRTPARLGVGRAGTRYRTQTLLDFQADHAAARDAVVSALDTAVLEKLGFVALTSAAQDKREFLIRPDLGRRLSAESEKIVAARGARSPQVQIVAADGLSAAAVNVNLPLVYPPLAAALQKAGLRLGTPFAISNGSVAAADHVARITNAEVLCLLVGERPGLKTAESMGVYVTFVRVKDFNESKRSVISNIHAGGLVPADGAAQIAALVLRAWRDKRTGLDL